MSNLPIEIHLIFDLPSGKKSKTIGMFFSFLFEDKTPSGLFSINNLVSDSAKEIMLPSYSTSSFLFTDEPIKAI